jgi:hypothetical protein
MSCGNKLRETPMARAQFSASFTRTVTELPSVQACGRVMSNKAVGVDR